MPLPDVRKLTPNRLYTLVAAGVFDKYSIDALDKAGLFDPTIWGDVIGLDNAGNIVWRPQNSLGGSPVLDEYSATISSNQLNAAIAAMLGANATVGPSPSSYANASWAKPRFGTLGQLSLAGGTIADHVLWAAQAGYYLVIRIKGVWSNTTFTATFDFEDEDNNDLLGIPGTFDLDLVANEVVSLDPPMVGWAPADNKDIEVDITGGAGAENLYIIYEISQET